MSVPDTGNIDWKGRALKAEGLVAFVKEKLFSIEDISDLTEVSNAVQEVCEELQRCTTANGAGSTFKAEILPSNSAKPLKSSPQSLSQQNLPLSFAGAASTVVMARRWLRVLDRHSQVEAQQSPSKPAVPPKKAKAADISGQGEVEETPKRGIVKMQMAMFERARLEEEERRAERGKPSPGRRLAKNTRPVTTKGCRCVTDCIDARCDCRNDGSKCSDMLCSCGDSCMNAKVLQPQGISPKPTPDKEAAPKAKATATSSSNVAVEAAVPVQDEAAGGVVQAESKQSGDVSIGPVEKKSVPRTSVSKEKETSAEQISRNELEPTAEKDTSNPGKTTIYKKPPPPRPRTKPPTSARRSLIIPDGLAESITRGLPPSAMKSTQVGADEQMAARKVNRRVTIMADEDKEEDQKVGHRKSARRSTIIRGANMPRTRSVYKPNCVAQIYIPATFLNRIASKYGFLQFKKSGSPKFSKRYFVLITGFCYIFKKAPDCLPMLWINLKDDGVVPRTEVKDNVFKLYVDGKMHSVKAENAAEAKGWLKAFDAEIAFKKSLPNASSQDRKRYGTWDSNLRRGADYVGFLQKKSSFNNGWRRRYFVLVDSMLLYYKSDRDQEPVHATALPGYRIAAAPEQNMPCCFKLCHDSPSIRDWYLAAEDKREERIWRAILGQAAAMQEVVVPHAVDHRESIALKHKAVEEGDIEELLSVDDTGLPPVCTEGKDFFRQEQAKLPPGNWPPERIFANSTVLERPPSEVDWYRHIFSKRPHDNFIAKVDALDGVIFLSVLAERVTGAGTRYRVIVWARKEISQRIVFSESEKVLSLNDILKDIDPVLYEHRNLFRRVATTDKLVNELCKIENDEPLQRMKIGVLFAREGQTTETDIFGNSTGSEAFEEFLDLLGDRVRLKGYKGYTAQLNTLNDKDGPFSVAAKFRGYDIMFHVSTLLHFDPEDPQQVQRKRHIGNDIVVVVFMDGETSYPLDAMLSQYTRVLPCVQAAPSYEGYRFATGCMTGVPNFGPPSFGLYPKSRAFAEMLLTKCINGQTACVHGHDEFMTRARRTRKAYLDLIYADFYDTAKKTTKLDSAVSPSAATFITTPQVFTPTPLATGQPTVTCVALYEGICFFATAASLFRVVPGGTPEQVSNMSSIVDIVVVPELEAALVLNAVCAVALSLKDLVSGADLTATMLPHTKGAAAICAGKLTGGELVVCIAKGTQLTVLGSAPDFDVLKTLHLGQDPIQALYMIPPLGVVAACGSTAVVVELSHGGKASRVQPAMAASARQSSESDALLFARRISGRKLLLCFHSAGVVVETGASGLRRLYSLPTWTDAPVHCTVACGYLIVVSRTLVEVLSYENGFLVETHPLIAQHSFRASTGSSAVLVCRNNSADCVTRLDEILGDYDLSLPPPKPRPSMASPLEIDLPDEPNQPVLLESTEGGTDGGTGGEVAAAESGEPIDEEDESGSGSEQLEGDSFQSESDNEDEELEESEWLAAKANFSCDAVEDDEFSFKVGDIMCITDISCGDWYVANIDGERGAVPANYFTILGKWSDHGVPSSSK